jgi:predicted transposase/invertase (TIGR01784 family)
MKEKKEKYINPLTDFGFKKLFGTEPNKFLLIDFLNQILPDKKIKDLSYSSGEEQGLTELDRKAIFDLYCVGDNGERFIVEMQKAKQNFLRIEVFFMRLFRFKNRVKETNGTTD